MTIYLLFILQSQEKSDRSLDIDLSLIMDIYIHPSIHIYIYNDQIFIILTFF